MGNPLEKLWKDRCTVYQQIKSTNPKTKLTEFIETETIKDQPCKLSFETLSTTGGDAVAIVSQSVNSFFLLKLKFRLVAKLLSSGFIQRNKHLYMQEVVRLVCLPIIKKFHLFLLGVCIMARWGRCDIRNCNNSTTE